MIISHSSEYGVSCENQTILVIKNTIAKQHRDNQNDRTVVASVLSAIVVIVADVANVEAGTRQS